MPRHRRGPTKKIESKLELHEVPLLEQAMKKSQRDVSSLVRWLITEYATGRLVEWQIVQTDQLVLLTRRLVQQVESLQAANIELPDPKTPPVGGRATVTGKITDVEGSSKDSGKPSSSHRPPK